MAGIKNLYKDRFKLHYKCSAIVEIVNGQICLLNLNS